MPPAEVRLPEATWKAIRWYMKNPPNWREPEESEVLNPTELSILQGTLSPDQRKQLEIQHQEAIDRERERKAQDKIAQAARTVVIEMAKEANIGMKDIGNVLAANGIPEITADNAEEAKAVVKSYIDQQKTKAPAAANGKKK